MLSLILALPGLAKARPRASLSMPNLIMASLALVLGILAARPVNRALSA